jgi:hypothetical protein
MEDARRLWGVPRFDLMQVHNLLAWREHLKTLRRWKDEGRARLLGVTTSHGSKHEEMQRVLKAESHALEFMQITYSPADRSAEPLLDLAAAFGGDAGKVIDQVAPDQPLLKHLTGLTPKQRGIALEGAGLIAGKGYKPPEDLDAAIRARIGTAMNGFNETARTGVIEATRGFYAYYKGRAGDDGSQVDQKLVRMAVDRALGNIDPKSGEDGGRDGLAVWRGDIRYALPYRMSDADFRSRIAGKALQGFFWGDGQTPVTAKQLQEQFVPEKISGTRYRWRQIRGGGYALNKAGEPAVLDISKLKPRDYNAEAKKSVVRDTMFGLGF